ncbi:uncharacterized protein LOC106866158 [Brachypodium distachyon]|uniref:Uncharacterized protein n=1 Tax=Brachypodium distachyon TaxID=15368 RepID=A0A0Q3MWK3_BRADI|nr:uncharacterized protein LOC106866158 [Brachypodium distachyon]KQK08686.1 hypothetical protein BRADI_2g43270v3 [Brachypodium distachyon]|eukprot:XP_014754395.1 uncharacterized protein LOC106866158 [Brachypodium distachyon]
MHRSSSYYLQSSSSATTVSSAAASVAGGPGGNSNNAAAMGVDQLPTYDPLSDAAKKEALDASRGNLTHPLVHLVPVVVLLCALLLWSLSTTPLPPTGNAEVGVVVLKKGRLMALKSGPANDWDGSGMMAAGTEDPDLDDKAASHGLTPEQLDGDTFGKRIKKDGLKK